MIPCEQGWHPSGEMSSTGKPKDSCRHCGRTKKWHESHTTRNYVKEFLEQDSIKNTPYAELAEIVLTKYTEWRERQI